MCSTAAVPVWKAAGMSYVTYSKICSKIISQCRKDYVKPEAPPTTEQVNRFRRPEKTTFVMDIPDFYDDE